MDILTIIVLIITLTLLLILLSMIWPPDSPWSPWWRTDSVRARKICEFAKITKNDIIYDLGSGDGTLLITAASKYGAKAVGIEIDPLRTWIARLTVLLKGQNKNVKIIQKNFFESDISNATVIFMYLVPKALARLKPKLLKELKPGTRVVTFVYKIDLPIIQEDQKNEFYLYEVPKKSK